MFIDSRTSALTISDLKKKLLTLTCLISVQQILFVCNRGDTYYSTKAGSRQGSLAKLLSLLFLGRRYHLTSIEFWSAYFDLDTYTVLAHQWIPLLLPKSAFSCWMYPNNSGVKEILVRNPSVRSTDLKLSSKLSLQFAWITGPATDPSFAADLINYNCRLSWKRSQLCQLSWENLLIIIKIIL